VSKTSGYAMLSPDFGFQHHMASKDNFLLVSKLSPSLFYSSFMIVVLDQRFPQGR
jgi:hypothetical protein